MTETHFDWIIVGSGFGGSTSAYRLTEKGYSVLVIERGPRWKPEDFPKTNWNLKKWLWWPSIGFHGIFQMTPLKHLTAYTGVGVGGGSLGYACTHPTPPASFFGARSWGHLADWETELAPHYESAKAMLGVATFPIQTRGDRVVQEIARDMGREEHHRPVDVAVYFGKPGEKVKDPYFDGRGPDRVGCTFCGACMTGCRVGAKNTLDNNYLYLAEQQGAVVLSETKAKHLSPRDDGGYRVLTKSRDDTVAYTCDRLIVAGGVIGTLRLLLKMKEDPTGLPNLSDRIGYSVSSNSEALLAVVCPDKGTDFSKGTAITSILDTDEHSHVEPARYAKGSGAMRLLMMPHAPGRTLLARLWTAFVSVLRHPVRWWRVFFVRDFAKHMQVFGYMRTLEDTLRLRLGRSWRTAYRRSLVSEVDDPSKAPKAFMPEATDFAERFAEKVDGVTMNTFSETLFSIPSTAHILGGACMGTSAEDGVIDANHEVFNYRGMYVIDGSAVSANPGVNPSLTITALAERAMSLIPQKRLTESVPNEKGRSDHDPRALLAEGIRFPPSTRTDPVEEATCPNSGN